MATRDTMRILAPEFADSAVFLDATLDVFLAQAALRLDATAWGDLYAQGSIYLAAHLLKVAELGKLSAGAGPVVGVKSGKSEMRFGAVVGVLNDDARMATTPYGIQYLELRNTLGSAAIVV